MIDPTRAAVSQPEPEGLSDEELMELMPQQFRDDLATVSRMAAHGAGPDVGAGLFRVSLNTGALEFARAVEAATLARALLTAEADRAQRQPVPPEPVEVQELVGLIRQIALAWEPDARLLGNMTAEQAARAADLLERQAASAPMASDTRYEFSVIDADCTEQAGGSAPTYAQALSEGQHYLAQYQQDGPHALEVRRVEVLHPDALPLLPEGAQVIEPAKHTILVPVPVPVAVSERLPGPGDCDATGRCWWFCFECPGEHSYWILAKEVYCNPTYWLPAHALPLPGEVEG